MVRRPLPPTTAPLRYDGAMPTTITLDPSAEATRLRALAATLRPRPDGRTVHMESDAERMLELVVTGPRTEAAGSNAPRDLARLGRLDLAVLVVLAAASRTSSAPLGPTAIARRMGHMSCDGALAQRIRDAGARLAEPVILRIVVDLDVTSRPRPTFVAWAEERDGRYRLDESWAPLAATGWPAVEAAALRTGAGSMPGRRLVLWADLARRGQGSVEVEREALEGVLGIESPRPPRRAARWAEAVADLDRLLTGVPLQLEATTVRLDVRR
jgi:hypothetical protein